MLWFTAYVTLLCFERFLGYLTTPFQLPSRPQLHTSFAAFCRRYKQSSALRQGHQATRTVTNLLHRSTWTSFEFGLLLKFIQQTGIPLFSDASRRILGVHHGHRGKSLLQYKPISFCAVSQKLVQSRVSTINNTKLAELVLRGMIAQYITSNYHTMFFFLALLQNLIKNCIATAAWNTPNKCCTARHHFPNVVVWTARRNQHNWPIDVFLKMCGRPSQVR